MAELFGVFTGAMSVVSLAVQIVDSIQKLHDFCTAVRDVPRVFLHILEELELLGSILMELENELEPTGVIAEKARHPSAKDPLDYCSRAAQELHSLVLELNFLSKDTKTRRKWAAVKAVLKKDRVEGIQKRLESAKSMLNLAISYVSLQLQIDLKRSSLALAQTVLGSGRDSSTANPAKSVSKASPPSDVSEYQDITSKHVSLGLKSNPQGSLEVAYAKHYWIGIGWYVNRHLRGHPRPSSKGAISKSEFVTYLNQRFERMFLPLNFLGIKGFSFGSCHVWGNWQYTFRTIRVVSDTAEIFKICTTGSIDKVREKIESGSATLFDTTSSGYTLLHIAAAHARPDLCLWLLNQGIPSDSVCLPQHTNALHLIVIVAGFIQGRSTWPTAPLYLTKNLSDRPLDVYSTVRILVEHGHLDPMTNMSLGRNCFHICSAPPETFEYLRDYQEHFYVDQNELMENGSDVLQNQVAIRSAHNTELIKASLGRKPISNTVVMRSLYLDWGPYCRENMYERRPSDWTILHAVLWRVLQRYVCAGSLDVGFRLASDLIDAGANIHAQTYIGATPLDQILDFNFTSDTFIQQIVNNGELRFYESINDPFNDKDIECDRSPLILRWLGLLRRKGISLHKYACKEEELHPGGLLVPHDYSREGLQRIFEVEYVPGGDDIVITIRDVVVGFEKPFRVPGSWVPDEEVLDCYHRTVLSDLPPSANWRINTAVDLPPLP